MELGPLTTAVGDLCVPLERASLLEALGLCGRLEAKVLAALGEYEAAGLCEVDGQRSLKGWLRAEADLPPSSARIRSVRAAKLHALADLTSAVLEGRISGGQLDVILARVPRRHVARFRSHCPELVDDLARLDAAGTAVAMDRWLQVAEAEDPAPLPKEHDSQVSLGDTIDGRGEMRASMDPDLNALVRKAFDVADPKDFDLSMPQRRAAALGQICQTFLDLQDEHKGGRHRPHLNVLIDLDDLLRRDGQGGRYVDTDGPVSPEAMLKHICDASWHRLLGGTSTILDYGSSTRDWPVNLWNAIAVRDGGCRWPGCDAPVAWCDIHHVEFWEHHGPTSLHNGVMLCRHHHTRTHKPGHTLKLTDDATVEVTLPTGRFLTSEPRGPSPNRRTGRHPHAA